MRSLAHASRSLAASLIVSGALPLALATAAAAQQWPSFRGADASGVDAAGQPPLTWDVAAGTNVAWRTPIPGLGHSSPVVWDDRIFVTSAVPLPGPAGEAGANADGTVILQKVGSIPTNTRHAWRLYCLDRTTGRVLWERTAHEGMPRVKRHAKASQASATPVTDGRHVVAMMGSEGLYAFDMQGTPLWTKDLGRLDVGYVDDKNEEWGPGSSPVIHDGLVIVQNDRHADSYVIAFDVRTGQEKWRVGRDEMPSWATPLVHRGTRTTIVTNSPKAIRGHDAATGKELWQVADGTQVKVPTPVVFEDLVIVTGGWPPGGRPIFAIKAATGEIAWKLDRGSPYTTTPVVYQGVLYVCVDNGVLSAYDARTGRRHYQRRIANDAGGFSGSPVAAAGRIYLPSEDGVMFVVRAGRRFELLARNDMREMLLATPAVVGDLMLVRTRTHLVALRGTPQPAADVATSAILRALSKPLPEGVPDAVPDNVSDALPDAVPDAVRDSSAVRRP
jgi:outer membrane protein assembly factor BamB